MLSMHAIISGEPLSTPEIDTEVTDGTATDNPAKVILFNDNVHTFEDVITQLQKAISCSRDKGEALAMEVHTRGRACVYVGEMDECLRISSVLEEIALHTQIEM
jgi:ATP-dependent Clp protease adapter protein ClpS